MARKFIIEHLEPELYEWCLIEYEHISKIIGKNSAIFTNINKKYKNKLSKYGTIYEKSISELNFKKICILDQYSKKQLTAEDKNKFQYFVFGGILGDNPAQKRTNEIIDNLKKCKIKFEARTLGNKQMPTDTAVYVAKKILDGKTRENQRRRESKILGLSETKSRQFSGPRKSAGFSTELSDFKFVDELEIEINENESITLPFRFVVDNNKLIINEKLVEYLRKRKSF